MDSGSILHDFFIKESSIGSFSCNADTEAISEFADRYKIAKIDFVEYLSEEDQKNGHANLNIVYYDSYRSQADQGIEFKDPRALDGCYLFRAFPYAGTIWTKEESDFAYSVIRMLSLIKGKKRIFNKLRYLSTHDPLSGEFNMPYAIQFIKKQIASNNTIGYVVMFLNVRGMNEINRSFSFDDGTMLMFKYIRKLKEKFGEDEIIWRLGGDNFGGFFRREHLDDVLSKIKSCSIEDKDGFTIKMSAVAGISILDGTETSHSGAFDGAQQSLAIARYIKHVPYQFYDDDIVKMNNYSTHIEMEFDSGVNNNCYVPFYQPKVSLESRRLIGAEALCRWKIKDDYLVPALFIPTLERSGRICILDFIMLKRLCRDMRSWLDQGLDVVPVSINFSRKHLSNIRLASDICAVVDSDKIPHELIVIEFTETTNEADQKRLRDIVIALKGKGFKTSVDDFGVGYSSMSMIRDISFDELKMDRSFIITADDLDNDERKKIMMKHVIGMASDLGMTCIAEGAETPEHIDLLKENGCGMVQGYYFDKPLPCEEFVKRLEDADYYAST